MGGLHGQVVFIFRPFDEKIHERFVLNTESRTVFILINSGLLYGELSTIYVKNILVKNEVISFHPIHPLAFYHFFFFFFFFFFWSCQHHSTKNPSLCDGMSISTTSWIHSVWLRWPNHIWHWISMGLFG